MRNHAGKSGAQACGLKVAGTEIGHQATWLSIDTAHPLLVSLSGETCLDNMIFASHHIPFDCYVKGQKVIEISDEVIENYKNTLKYLR